MACRSYLGVPGGSFLLLLAMLASFLLSSRDPKKCEMSYSRPIYLKQLSFDTSWSPLAGKYNLYLYREGGIDISENVYRDSQPVLFIPGHAGSYKQARSIASETTVQFDQLLKQRGRQGQQAKLDFFTLDYNEELSAIHGPTLISQAEFANDAVRYILSLYDTSTSIIIVGHSMGGVIARVLPTIPNYNGNKLNTIITLSCPHSVPPAPVDRTIANMYRDINAFWSTELPDGALKDIALISLAGGNLDNIVASDASSIHGLVPKSHGFSVYTTGIPEVWTGADHMAILWCNQLVKRLSTAIIKLIDEKQPSHIKPLHSRISIMKKLLLSRLDNIDETFVMGTTTTKEHDALEAAVIITTRIHTPFQSDVPIANQIVFNTQTAPSADFQIVTSAQPTTQLKVNICKHHNVNGQLLCNNVISNAASLPQPERWTAPSLVSLRIPNRYLMDKEVIVVDLPQQPAEGYFKAEFQTQDEQLLVLNHTLFELLFQHATFEFPMLEGGMVHLPYIRNPLFRYKLFISTPPYPECTVNTAPIIRMSTNYQYESKFFTDGQRNIDISFHGESAFAVGQQLPHADGGLKLQVFNQPHCGLQATLKVDVFSSLGRMLMQHGIALAVLPFAFASMVLCYQLATVNATQNLPTWKAVAQRLYLRFLIFGSSTLTGLAVFSHQSTQITSTIGIYDGMFGLGISGPEALWPSIILVLSSVGLVLFVALVLYVLVWIINRTLIFMHVQRGMGPTNSPHADPMKRSVVYITIILLLCRFIPPPVLFIVIFLVQIFICSQALTASTLTNDSRQYRLQFSVLVILFCLLPYNGPASLVWIQHLIAGWYERPDFMGTLEGGFQSAVLVAFMTRLRSHGRVVPNMAYANASTGLGWVVMTYCFVIGIHLPYSLPWVACCIWLLWMIPTKTKRD